MMRVCPFVLSFCLPLASQYLPVVRCAQLQHWHMFCCSMQCNNVVHQYLIHAHLNRLSLLPIAGFYAFVRVAYGMEGLNPNLKGYSFFVLVVELLGMINMLFYGCWLFAKANNKDVHARVDEQARFVSPLTRF
jgi:hypothetical protein